MSYKRALIRTDELGNLLAASVADGYCWFTWSEDGGATWQTPRRVTLDLADDEQPGLVEMSDGSLRIAVTQSDAVRIYASESAGESWVNVGVVT